MRLGAAAAAAQASAPGELLMRGAGEDAAGDCGALGVHPVLLAACNAAEHGAWRKQLQGCANAAHAAALAARRHETVPLLMATESCFEAGVPGARTRTRLVWAFSALPVDQGFRCFGQPAASIIFQLTAGSQTQAPCTARSLPACGLPGLSKHLSKKEKQLRLAALGTSVPDAARARGGAAPSALVVQRLCAAGREQGAELLRRARAARLAFHSGALPASFTVETAGAGRAMQALSAHLHEMQEAAANHGDVGALPRPAPTDKARA